MIDHIVGLCTLYPTRVEFRYEALDQRYLWGRTLPGEGTARDDHVGHVVYFCTRMNMSRVINNRNAGYCTRPIGERLKSTYMKSIRIIKRRSI